MTSRQGDVEMSAALWFLSVGENPELTRPADFRVAAYCARLADQTGAVRVSSDARDALQAISEGTGLGLSTVYKALGDLSKSGLIDWKKTSGPSRVDKLNRIRLILPAVPA